MFQYLIAMSRCQAWEFLLAGQEALPRSATSFPPLFAEFFPCFLALCHLSQTLFFSNHCVWIRSLLVNAVDRVRPELYSRVYICEKLYPCLANENIYRFFWTVMNQDFTTLFCSLFPFFVLTQTSLDSAWSQLYYIVLHSSILFITYYDSSFSDSVSQYIRSCASALVLYLDHL